MKNKINIAELLKDCPRGMELDCTICNNVVTLEGVDTVRYYPIRVMSKDGYHHILTHEGCVYKREDAKCVIFPKGKTTWEGFQRPFKDGDILFVKSAYNWVFIYKESENKEDLHKYAATPIHPNHTYITYDNNPLCYKRDVSEIRLATEEEKEKLFHAIKNNGYNWNEETKTLEKLVEPKFKIGDRVRNKNYKDYIYDIHDITDKGYRAKEINADSPIIILFGSQEDNYELVPNKFDITTLIPFESRVLMRSSNAREWVGTFYSHYSNNKFYGCGMCCDQCIPYEKNEHLLGTTNDCDEFYKNW